MNVRRAACALLLVVALPLIATAETTPPKADDFYRLPAYRSVTLSPDGRKLAAIVPLNGHANLALVDLDRKTAVPVTGFTEVDAYDYRWLGNRIVEVFAADLSRKGGADIKAHLLVDIVDGATRDLMARPQDGAGLRSVSRFGHTRVLDALDADGDDLLIETLDRSIGSYDAYRYRFSSGSKTLLTFHSPGDVVRYVADRRGQVRVAVSEPRGGLRRVVSGRATDDDEWKVLRDEPAGDDAFAPLAFDDDGRTLYVRVRDRERGGRSDVRAFDTQTGELGARLYASDQADPGDVLLDRVRHTIVGVRDGSKDQAHWLDPKWRQLQAAIDEVLPAAHNRLTWARDNTDRLVVESETESRPTTYYLFDRQTLRLEEVAKARPWLRADDLSARSLVQYRARDGLPIPAYLTMPKKPDGVKPPLVVVIHGGPFVDGYHFGYDDDSQFFASRGYAVLEPNFRGTTGLGKAFEKAGWRQWGLAMQDDVTDGVKWLIDSGKVDGDRVCLYGASYGGYATLWGLEKEPSMFRCGIAMLAVSDLELMFDATWSDFMRAERGDNATQYFTRVLGDAKNRDALRATSPARHADRVQGALMLVYGGNDERVPIAHGNAMRDALDRAHKPYDWVFYPDQRHMHFDPETGGDFYARVEAFLMKNNAARSPAVAASPSAAAAGGATSLEAPPVATSPAVAAPGRP